MSGHRSTFRRGGENHVRENGEMSGLGDTKSRGRPKSKGRGSVNNKSRLEAFARSSASTGADWGGCSAERLQGVVMGITELGGAVTFGMSRDLGAHSLTLMLDGSRETLWFNADADLDQQMQDVIGKLESMV